MAYDNNLLIYKDEKAAASVSIAMNRLVTSLVHFTIHITMSYHALMQPRVLLLDATGLPDAQYNYYKDFSGCLLIDNGRVTPLY